ncbi:MAG: methyltransferase [Candidatus Acidiferrales bacterium]
MSFRATDFEFRYRLWFIAGIFAVAFWCYSFDRMNVSVALSRAIAVAVHDRNPDAVDRYVRGFFVLGTFIVTGAALVRSWAESYLHSSIVHDMDLHSDSLVADGPYRHLRNPLYLGTDLLALGIGFLASRTGFVVLAVGMTIFTYRLVFREEAGLLASQGENYRRFFASVPRFVPSLAPRVPAAGRRPNWVDGFTGEIFMWGCAVGMALFAATENILYYWVAMGTGFAIYFVQALMRKRAAARSTPGAA